MSATRRKKRRGRAERALDVVERVGESALVAAWRSVTRALRTLLRLLGAAWARACELPMPGRLALVGIAGIAIGWYALRGAPTRVDDETEALARVIRSEAGVQSLQNRLHVAWATRNLAAERGETVAEMACSPCGPQQRGRPVASRQEARDIDRELARLVLESPPMADPTGGATHFINPALQDQLARRGRPGYRGRSYQVVRRIWSRSYGWEPYYRLGSDLELWGPRRTGR